MADCLELHLQPPKRVADSVSIARVEDELRAMRNTLDVISYHLVPNTEISIDVPAGTDVQASGAARVVPAATSSAPPSRTPFGQPAPVLTAGVAQSTGDHTGSALANVSTSPGAAPDNINTLSDARSAARRLQFGERILTFEAASVPDPPIGLSYAGDKLEQLFVDWYESAHLKIEGHPIALCHWPRVYQCRAGLKKNAWPKYRSTWHNWKVSTQTSAHARRTHLRPVSGRRV